MFNIYHNETFEFLRSTTGQLDPVESEKAGEDVFMIPPFSTDVALPEYGENEIPVLVDGSWVVKSDFRGVVFYEGDDENKITAIGDLVPTGATIEASPGEGYTVVDGAWVVDINKQREELKRTRCLSLANMTYDFGDGRIMQVRPGDLSNIQMAISEAQDLEWIMADDIPEMVTVAELQLAMASGLAQGKIIWQDNINALKTLA